jgi:ribosomal RNA-processing protein 12
MGRVSLKILPSLFKLVDSLHETQGKPSSGDEMDTRDNADGNKDAFRILAVTQSIASIARLAPKAQIQSLFTKVVQRMLQASQSEDDKMTEKMCSLLTLSQALVVSECLDESSMLLLYRSLKPLIRTDETPPRIQKRAYKLLAEICKRYHSFVAEGERLKEVMELLSNTSATSQVSARFMRLKCLSFVVEGFEGSAQEVRQVSVSRSRVCQCWIEISLASNRFLSTSVGNHNVFGGRNFVVLERLECQDKRCWIYFASSDGEDSWKPCRFYSSDCCGGWI